MIISSFNYIATSILLNCVFDICFVVDDEWQYCSKYCSVKMCCLIIKCVVLVVA